MNSRPEKREAVGEHPAQLVTGHEPSRELREAFAESPAGKRATGNAHPETVKNALAPADARFYGGSQDAVAILHGLLDAALAEIAAAERRGREQGRAEARARIIERLRFFESADCRHHYLDPSGFIEGDDG